MADENNRPGGNLKNFVNNKVNEDSIKGKYKKFQDSDIQGRYNVGSLTDDLSSISSSLPGRFQSWIDSQGGNFTREDYYNEARRQGAERQLGTFGIVTSQAQAELDLAIAEKRWAKFTLGQSESFLDAVENVSNVINLSWKPQLEIGKAYLEAYVDYLELLQNPALAALKVFVDEIRDLLNDFAATGVYFIQITSEDIGKDVTFNLRLNSDWTLMGKSSFLTNPLTRKIEYIDYEYQVNDITGNPIYDSRTGSPVPLTDANGLTIRRNSSQNPGFLKNWSTLPFKQATFPQFIEELKSQFKFKKDDNGCITPVGVPAFSDDAITAAIVLYIGAPSIKDFAPVLVKLVNAFQGAAFQPIIAFLRTFFEFGNLFTGLDRILIGKTPDLVPYIVKVTKVKNPGDGGADRRRLVAGTRPVLKWDPDAPNDYNKSGVGNYIDNRKEVDVDPTSDEETPSINYLIANPQGQSASPDRVFIRGEQSGVVMEVAYIAEEKLIEETLDTGDNNSENTTVEPTGTLKTDTYYNQTLVCTIVDHGLSKKIPTAGERFYEVEPHGLYEPYDTATGLPIDESIVAAYSWRMKNGYNLLGNNSERDIVVQAIKYAQIQYYFTTTFSAPQSAEAVAAKRAFDKRISDVGIAIRIPVSRNAGQRDTEFTISGGEYSSSQNRTRFELRIVKEDEVKDDIRATWDKEYQLAYVTELWNYVISSEQGYLFTEDPQEWNEKSKDPNSVIGIIDRTYRPIENALVNFISDSSVTNIFGSSDIMASLKAREWWTWRQDFELSPSPVYGFIEEITADILMPDSLVIQTCPVEPKSKWSSVTVRDFFVVDDLISYIEGFLDTIESIIEEISTFIRGIINILQELISTIDALISALDTFLNFIKLLGDLGLYVLVIDGTDSGGNGRIISQIENAPGRPPDTLKYGYMAVLMSGWPNTEPDGPAATAWNGVKTLFGLSGDENPNPDYQK